LVSRVSSAGRGAENSDITNHRDEDIKCSREISEEGRTRPIVAYMDDRPENRKELVIVLVPGSV
jgi:hypothetical protein